MYKDYPNLELIEYKCRIFAKNTLELNGRRPEFDATVFSQVWGSTALGFPGIGGSMMTEAYTTVMEERVTGTFFVFFGGELCYQVTDPNKAFFEDLKNRNLEGQIKAIGKYMKKEEESG